MYIQSINITIKVVGKWEWKNFNKKLTNRYTHIKEEPTVFSEIR